MGKTPSKSLLVSLKQLAQATIGFGEADFVAKHPQAVAVIQLPGNSGDLDSTSTAVKSNVPTPTAFDTFRGVHRLLTHADLMAAATAASKPKPAPDQATASMRSRLATAVVIPFIKTGRNAFSDMITIGRATNNDIALRVATV